MLWNGMNQRRVLCALLPVSLLGMAACSSAASSAVPATSTTTATVTSPAPSTSSTVATPPAPPLTADATTIPPTSSPAPTTEPVVPSSPPPVIMPQPQVCLDPTSADEPVEFVITDYDVTYHGDIVPECMHIPESFALRFINNAEGDATVGMGAYPGMVFAGETVTSAPLGEIFFVGDEFELSFPDLGLSVTVEVLPVP